MGNTYQVRDSEHRQPDQIPLLEIIKSLASKYGLRCLALLITSCEAPSQTSTLQIAVLGRFKAGKSSFLNHLIGQNVLSAGVVPITSVITEIGHGPTDRAIVHFQNGLEIELDIDQIREFIAESENPENRKQVAHVSVELRSLAAYRGVHFIDTPGLESSLSHNTETSRSWLPNVGLAIVAVSVDRLSPRETLN